MKYIAQQNQLKFEIEEDLPEAGWYLYVFDENDTCIKDYLQDTKQSAMNFALEEFLVPLNSWTMK